MVENTKSTGENITRAPIVTIMGHVDHGKTSLLDAIRQTHVVDREFGGITQHIGAYQIERNSHKITFIDTPGHAAFSQMRARGGKAADLVILVVAATEGVMPQTKESILHAKAAGVPIIVAINKIDVAGADPAKVIQDLAAEGVMVESWGGDVVAVNISAKTGEGIDKLLDSLIAQAEIMDIRANPNGELEAIIVEARSDSKRGVIVSAIIKNGTLHVGDDVFASGINARVRAITDDKGLSLNEAGLSDPVEISGFSKVPNVGDLLVKKGSELAELAVDESRIEIVGKNAKRTIAIVLRADTQGTLEAVKASLANLVTSSVGATFALKFLLSATGDVTDSDVLLAYGAKGLVVGFDVKIPSKIADLADSLKVQVKTYKTIYDLTDEIKTVLEGSAFDAEAKIKGRARVLKIFKLPSGDIIVGSKVLAGALREGGRVSIYDKDPSELKKEDVPLYTGNIHKLKKGKEEVTLVGKDNECGVLLKPQYEEAAPDMWIEVR